MNLAQLHVSRPDPLVFHKNKNYGLRFNSRLLNVNFNANSIRAACDVSDDTELWIFGSQAILGEFPNAPESLRASIEVDVQPKNRPETVDYIDGALGDWYCCDSEDPESL